VRVERTLRTVLLCVGVLMVAMSAGCGEPPPPVDTSLLTGEPCEPPCWQGLTPGESTEEDVAEFMKATRFVDTRSVRRGSYTRLTLSGEEVTGVIIYWRSSGGLSPCNDFSIEEGVLTDLTICPYPGVTLGRLIDRYGPPEKYVSHLSGYERQWVDVTLYYPTHGFTVYLMLRPDDATLKPESKVVSIWYFRAAPLERFLQLGWEAGYFSSVPAGAEEFGHDWQGYGRVPLG